MDKKMLILFSAVSFAGIAAITGILFFLNKIYIKDKNKILKLLSLVLSYPLFKNNKKIITDIIDTALKLRTVKEIQVENSDNSYKVNKLSDEFPKHFLSAKIVYDSKNIGILKIAFTE